MAENAVMVSELSDSELDAVAAGNGGHSHSSNFFSNNWQSNSNSTSQSSGWNLVNVQLQSSQTMQSNSVG